MFSSRGFIAFGLPFRSLIHFEFIFVYGARECAATWMQLEIVILSELSQREKGKYHDII